jgi:hypothetical protein
LVCAPSRTSKADEGPTLVVDVEGAESDAVTNAILELVPQDTALVQTEDFRNALRKAGWRGPMGNVIAVPASRGPLIRATIKAMNAVGAKYAVLGRVRKTRTLDTEVWLLFIDAENPKPQLDEAVPIPKRDPDRFAALRVAIGRPFSALARPEPPAASPTPPTGAEPEKSPTPPAKAPDQPKPLPLPARPAQSPPRVHDVGSALITLGLGYGLAGREFGYDKPSSLNLRPYHVFGAHLLIAEGELFPLTNTNASVLRDVGAYANYGVALGLNSAVEGGSPIGTNFDRFDAGIRARIHTGGPAAPLLGFRAGFGWMRFEFDDAAEIEDELPSVWYQFLHAGLDARFPIGPVAIWAGADYLGPVAAGAVGARFGNPRLWGISARAGVGLRLFSGFEARLGADYMIFGYKFSSQPTDAYAAAGARDQTFGLQLLIAYVY